MLCQRSTGEVIALTEKHHAEARGEAARLRRMGSNRLVSDSFGESRWMGAIENTRGYATCPLSFILICNTLLGLAMASGSHPASLQSLRLLVASSMVSLQPHTGAKPYRRGSLVFDPGHGWSDIPDVGSRDR